MGTLPAPVHTGKVRDLYDAGDDLLLMVASDRISAFDVVLPTPIPEKGALLTALSLWWFERLADVVVSHVVTADVDAYPEPFTGRSELRGRSMLVRRLEMIPVECVARAYLAGSAVDQYAATGAVCGVRLPAGLVPGSRLPGPIFTPTTKGGPTGHDEPISYADLAAAVGPAVAADLRWLTHAVFRRGAAVLEAQGLLLADTKVEFGLGVDGSIVLADEVLTPDSSRFWSAADWHPGRVPPSYDKQPVRDWLARLDWDRRPPGPELPDEVVEATRARYVTAYERITGDRWR